jgi:hypothetical protein
LVNVETANKTKTTNKGTKQMKSTLWVKRIVLVNGKQSGKGRPSKDTIKDRTCLYIPIRENYGNHTKASIERPYDPKRNANQRPQFKRTNMSALKAVGQPQALPVVMSPEAPAEAILVNAAPVAEISI